jgi:phage FluMu protein Com
MNASDKEIRCINEECNKKFAEVKTGNVIVTSSTAIEFEEKVQIQIRCPRCKKKQTLIFK